MGEVQCFEGDGAIPPEISALMRENERLKARLESMDAQHDQDQKYIMELTARVSLMQDKLYQIGQILAIREMPEYDDRYDKANMEPMLHPIGVTGPPPLTADEAFKHLIAKTCQ